MFIRKRLRMCGSAALAVIVCIQCRAMESSTPTMAELWNKVETGNFSDEVANKLFTTVNEWKRKEGEDIILEVLQSLPEIKPHVPGFLWRNIGREVSRDMSKEGVTLFESDYVYEVFNRITSRFKKEEVQNLLQSSNNILCARFLFTLEDSPQQLMVQNIPYIFISGINKGVNSSIEPFVKNISSYSFTASSFQTFAHSERAFALFLRSNEISYKKLESMYGQIFSWGFQIHNITNPMCDNCRNFLVGGSPYFVYNKMGYFVKNNYYKLYKRALEKKENWKEFLNVSISPFLKMKEYYESYTRLNGIIDKKLKHKEFWRKVVPYLFRDILKKYSNKFPLIFCTHNTGKSEAIEVIDLYVK